MERVGSIYSVVVSGPESNSDNSPLIVERIDSTDVKIHFQRQARLMVLCHRATADEPKMPLELERITATLVLAELMHIIQQMWRGATAQRQGASKIDE